MKKNNPIKKIRNWKRKKLILSILFLLSIITIFIIIKNNNNFSVQKVFPKPVGKYTVGRTQMDYKYIASDDIEREITTVIYYPSDTDEGKKTAEYGFSEFQEQRSRFLNDAENAKEDKLFNPDFKTWSYENLNVSATKEQYPVVFFSPGAGAYAEQGTVFAQDLASSGYIVVAMGHAESGVNKFLDGRVEGVSSRFIDSLSNYTSEFLDKVKFRLYIAKWKLPEKSAMKTSRMLTAAPKGIDFSKYAELQSEDISFVADNLYKMNSGEIDSIFKGRLQLDKGLGIFGHSFGGTTAAMVSRDDDRFVGSINLDGNMLGLLDSDLKKPFLQLGTVLAYNTNTFLLQTNSNDTYFAIIDGVKHGDFSDSLFTATEKSQRGSRDALSQRTILSTYMKGFFDKYLLKEDSNLDRLNYDGVRFFKSQ